jgi:hypothetical protein
MTTKTTRNNVDEGLDLDLGNWLLRKGAGGTARAAHAQKEYVAQQVDKDFLNSFRRAFNDAVGADMIDDSDYGSQGTTQQDQTQVDPYQQDQTQGDQVATQDQQTQQPQTAGGVWADPTSLEKQWEDYKAAGGKFTPALKQALNSIWMRAGGVETDADQVRAKKQADPSIQAQAGQDVGQAAAQRNAQRAQQAQQAQQPYQRKKFNFNENKKQAKRVKK